jgi:L-rhamnose isomerase
MRILLQHVGTQLYLSSLGHWTANHFEALDFQQSQRAIEFARDHNLSSVQIAVKFHDSHFDDIVPLPSVSPTAQRRVQ